MSIPEHIAIIMDGNGRWASIKREPRIAGHKAGIDSLYNIVEHSITLGIQCLTVYAFSSENWNRPRKEINLLLELFVDTIKKELDKLDQNGVKLCFIGEHSQLPKALQAGILQAEKRTEKNPVLCLNIAFNYGGRWEIVQACRRLVEQFSANQLTLNEINEHALTAEMQVNNAPDLLIRTGGEYRLSNYLLWQLAYTELHFTDILWPDFSPSDFDQALSWYAHRQRRFGQTPEQVSNLRAAR